MPILQREMKMRSGPFDDQKREGVTLGVPWLMNIPKLATPTGTIAHEVKGVGPSWKLKMYLQSLYYWMISACVISLPG